MRKGEEGFLYVEVLASLFIFSIAMLAIVPLFVTASTENAAAQDLTFATAIAQDKAEAMKIEDYSTLANGSDELVVHGIAFDRTWAVVNDTPHAGMKTVTVTVTPQRSQSFGRTRSATVSFYRVP
jgi:type II secretory pathway pseudopilin PulG